MGLGLAALSLSPSAQAQEGDGAPAPASPAPARAVTVETLRAGEGATPSAQDFVLVNYKGMLKDGTVFDQAEKAALPLPRMIPGFAQGIAQMKVGGSYRMTIPSELGYGAKASGPIPANSDLVFEVELLDYKTPEQYAQMVAEARAAQAEAMAASNAAAEGKSVEVETLSAGEGPKPSAQDYVLVNYKGMLKDGTVFDQVEKSALYLPQMIPGFARGITQMQVGGRYRMTIPPELGYGAQASGPIPANSELVFEVDLLDYRTREQLVAEAAAAQEKAEAEAASAPAADPGN